MYYASHLMLRPREERVLATSPGGRRALADTLLRASRPFPLLVFRAADTHIHLLLGCDKPTALECGRRIEIGLTQRLQLTPGFNGAHVRPVGNQRHLRNAFEYILRQEERHQIGRDPFHDASALPDLLGLRVVAPELKPRVREWLPRLDLGRFHELLPPPADTLDERVLGAAAAAAFALPNLRGHRPAVLAARAAAVRVGAALATARLAELLEVSPRTIRRLRHFPVPEVDRRAVEGQVRIRSGVASAPPSATVALSDAAWRRGESTNPVPDGESSAGSAPAVRPRAWAEEDGGSEWPKALSAFLEAWPDQPKLPAGLASSVATLIQRRR